MAKIVTTCSGCGARTMVDPNDLDYEPWMPPQCTECQIASEAGEILDRLRCGERREPLADLAEITTMPPQVRPEHMVEALIYEAGYYARRGDLVEAMHRLRLAAEPKFSNTRECKEQYDAAMIETRRAREACV